MVYHGMLVPVVACASLVQLVCGSPARFSRDYAVKDYHPAPRGWNNNGPAPADHVIDLSIGLTQSRFQELERHLYEVSDPKHPRYGQHLSDKEVNSLVRPSDNALEAVHHWLEEHGITADHLTYTPAKDWMKLSLPVSAVEKLLGTEYSVWEHSDGSTLARTESWSLPLHVHEHISTIQPTNSWARLDPMKQVVELEKRSSYAIEAPSLSFEGYPLPSSPEIAAVCNFSAVSPDCLRTLYGTINYTPQSDGESRIGVTDYAAEYNNRSDIYLFLEEFRPEAAQAAYEFLEISIAGGPVDNGTQHAADGTGLEGNLDAEYALGIAWPLNLTAYSTGGRDPTFMPSLSTPPPNSDEPFLAWVNYVLSLPAEEVPQVISTSYGDDEQTISYAYATAVCNQFAQLGARGVSLLVGSGDYGVGENDTCYSNADNTTKKFLPQFPATCPYTTVVGGTYLYPEQAVYAILSNGNVFASGAGFSNYFPQPSYQESVVQDYVSFLAGSQDGLYNKSGRAYPDISCVGQRFPTIWNGSTVALVGTSGSSPICSSILALVNDALLSDNKPTLGFLNPWLYGGGYEAFTDVTNGSSYGCQTDGFPARVGWDAVTGWGTPYFPDILGLLGFGEGYGESAASASNAPVATATASGAPVSQISDGQPQAPTVAPVSQISDGQPQAPTVAPVSQISDGQPQAPTGAPVSQISDGQPQAPSGTPVSQISDGQPQVTTSAS